MISNTKIIILAGGSGTRFWPESRDSKPKQFLDILSNGKSLLQMTLDRFKHFVRSEDIYILSLSRYTNTIIEHLTDFPPENILEEPQAKNTALSVAYASFLFHKINPDTNIIFAPSDHLIQEHKEFSNLSEQVLSSSEIESNIITIGIPPSFPSTGYGYIYFDDHTSKDRIMHTVLQFTEKPNKKTAEEFVQSGKYLWNAGIFISKAKTFVEAFRKHQEAIALAFDNIHVQVNERFADSDISNIFDKAKNISVDYAILEKIDNIKVLRATFDWNDLGTWTTVHKLLDKDDNQNALIGEHIFLENSSHNLVKTSKKKLVFAEGLEDYIVIDTKDVLLICKKENEQQIKAYREFILNKNLKNYL